MLSERRRSWVHQQHLSLEAQDPGLLATHAPALSMPQSSRKPGPAVLMRRTFRVRVLPAMLSERRRLPVASTAAENHCELIYHFYQRGALLTAVLLLHY